MTTLTPTTLSSTSSTSFPPLRVERLPAPGRIVLVVGVDLTDVSEHLMTTALGLVPRAFQAEVHVVHVVAREPLTQRLADRRGQIGTADRAHIQAAQFLLQKLRDDLFRSADARVFIHTPLGDPARELVRTARDVRADVLVLEAHEDRRRIRPLHRSLVARVAQAAPCSVLAVRRHPSAAGAGDSRAARAPLESTR